jgi:hypothetical protein
LLTIFKHTFEEIRPLNKYRHDSISGQSMLGVNIWKQLYSFCEVKYREFFEVDELLWLIDPKLSDSNFGNDKYSNNYNANRFFLLPKLKSFVTWSFSQAGQILLQGNAQPRSAMHSIISASTHILHGPQSCEIASDISASF